MKNPRLSLERIKKNRDTLGEALRNKRTSEGYTQKALADALGIEYYTMVSNMELGHMSIPPSLWGPIANALRMNRQEWILMCLSEIQPEVYRALFGIKDHHEVAKALKALEKGAYEET